jgi:hypothetical protein
MRKEAFLVIFAVNFVLCANVESSCNIFKDSSNCENTEGVEHSKYSEKANSKYLLALEDAQLKYKGGCLQCECYMEKLEEDLAPFDEIS